MRLSHKMGGDEYEEFQKVMKNHKEYVIFDVKHEKEMHDLGEAYSTARNGEERTADVAYVFGRAKVTSTSAWGHTKMSTS